MISLKMADVGSARLQFSSETPPPASHRLGGGCGGGRVVVVVGGALPRKTPKLLRHI